MATNLPRKSTIVRASTLGLRLTFALSERLAPRVGARLAERAWFTVPPVPRPGILPPGGRDFEIASQGGTIRGSEWGSGSVVYLVHGWGGRGSQLAAFVDPLVRTGHRVVLFDALSHGRSTAGPSGVGRSTAVEFGRALDDVAARFGPAASVIAHSLGALATLLASRQGWLGYERLVLLSPSLGVDDVLDVFTGSLGIGSRTRAALEQRIAVRVGMPLTEFQFDKVGTDPVPTLIVHDRTDRQTPYAASATFAERNADVELATTSGLGHNRLLRDPAVVAAAVAHVNRADRVLSELAS
jgi:pimeloyl-ACP methyl ester carboxylesterase